MNALGSFNQVIGPEPDLAYDQKTVEKITRNRQRLEKTLFFDRMLHAIGIEADSKLYPPRSNAELKTLYNTIAKSSALDHLRQSLVYYIIKDLHLVKDRKAHKLDPTRYAITHHLPSKYQTFVDGIWSLDRMYFEEAVEHLTDPSLVPTFPEEILYTLCKNRKDSELPLAYYHSVMPPIVRSGKTLEAVFEVMIKYSVTEAFFFTRKYDMFTRHHLFERLVSFVHGATGGQVRASRASELIALPLDEDEDVWFEEYLVEGEGKSLYGAKDTVIMRRIVMGRAEEAAELNQSVKERKIDGLNWSSLTEGLRQSSS